MREQIKGGFEIFQDLSPDPGPSAGEAI